MGRAPCCDKANVKKGPWAPEEDAKLKEYIEKYGTGGNWIALPQKIGLKRCGKSCRLRWLNYLRPNIKHGGFTEEEDNIICSLYISIGSRWSIIAAQLPGRTDNDIKNYWNTKLKKKLLGKSKRLNRLSSLGGQDLKDTNGIDENQLSNSALERLQLHMQLQNLQNPLAFHNNPALWPKLHPLQEKMIQNLYSLNGSLNTLIQPGFPGPQKADHLRDYRNPSNPIIDERENSLNGMTSSDGSMAFTIAGNNLLDCLDSAVEPKADAQEQFSNNAVQFQAISQFQTELENILSNKTANLMPQDVQIPEFDCLKEMNGAKNGSTWWTHDFDAKSESTSSWYSTSVPQPEGLFQDLELGYNL